MSVFVISFKLFFPIGDSLAIADTTDSFLNSKNGIPLNQPEVSNKIFAFADSSKSDSVSHREVKRQTRKIKGSVTGSVLNSPVISEIDASPFVYMLNAGLICSDCIVPFGIDFNYTTSPFLGLYSNGFRFYMDHSQLADRKKRLEELKLLDSGHIRDSLLEIKHLNNSIILFCKQRILEDSLKLIKYNSIPDTINTSHLAVTSPTNFENDSLDSIYSGYQIPDTTLGKFDLENRLDSLNKVMKKSEKIYEKVSGELDVLNKPSYRSGDYSAKDIQEQRKQLFDPSSIKTLEIGRVIPEPTLLSVNSPPVFGIQTVYDDNNFMAGVVVGKQIRISQFELYDKEFNAIDFPALSLIRDGFDSNYNNYLSMKCGVGKNDGTHLYVNFTCVNGYPLYQPYASNNNRSTNIAGEIEYQQPIAENSGFVFGVSSSALNNLASNESDNNYSFGRNYAVSANFHTDAKLVSLNVSGEYFSNYYQSYANPYVIPDRLKAGVIANWRVFKSLNITSGFEYDTRNISSDDRPVIGFARFRGGFNFSSGSHTSIAYIFSPAEYHVTGLYGDVNQRYYNHSLNLNSGFRFCGVKQSLNIMGSVVHIPAWQEEPVRTISMYSALVSQEWSRILTSDMKVSCNMLSEEGIDSYTLDFTSGISCRLSGKIQVRGAATIRSLNHITYVAPSATIKMKLLKNLDWSANCNKSLPTAFMNSLTAFEYSLPEYYLQTSLTYIY